MPDDPAATAFWTAIAPSVYVHALKPFAVNTYMITSSAGFVLVDSGNNAAQGRLIYDESLTLDRYLTPPSGLSETEAIARQTGRCVALINTHAHYDHCFGNSVFADAGIPIYGHARHEEHLATRGVLELVRYQHGLFEEGMEPGLWDDVTIAGASSIVENQERLTLGSEVLTMRAFAPAHTTADLAVHVPWANAWIVGDLVETAGEPSIETDSDLAGWVRALDWLLACGNTATMYLPGHGKPAGPQDVREQREWLRARM